MKKHPYAPYPEEQINEIAKEIKQAVLLDRYEKLSGKRKKLFWELQKAGLPAPQVVYLMSITPTLRERLVDAIDNIRFQISYYFRVSDD